MPRTLESNIPDMGAREIAWPLYKHARKAKNNIVEVGAWLGAGTYYLARGTEQGFRVPIHVFDRFSATQDEVEQAKPFGVELQFKQNTQDLVEANVDYHHLFLNKVNVMDIRWTGGPIDLYVDDTGKGPGGFKHKMQVFEPYFIPGVTKCFFMDYNWCKESSHQRHKFQHQYIDKYYSQIENYGLHSGGLFLYTGGR